MKHNSFCQWSAFLKTCSVIFFVFFFIWRFNYSFVFRKKEYVLVICVCTDHIRVGLVLIGCMCVYNSPCVIPAGSLKTLPNYSTSEAKRVWIGSSGKVLKWCPNLSPSAVSQARGWYFIHPNLDFCKLFCLWRKWELGSNFNRCFLGDGLPSVLCPPFLSWHVQALCLCFLRNYGKYVHASTTARLY